MIYATSRVTNRKIVRGFVVIGIFAAVMFKATSASGNSHYIKVGGGYSMLATRPSYIPYLNTPHGTLLYELSLGYEI